MASYNQLVQQAIASGLTGEALAEAKRDIERGMNRARGQLANLSDAQAYGAVGGPAIAGGKKITVRQGDNLFSLAQQIYGSDKYVEQLAHANPWLFDSDNNLIPNALRPGQTLNAPMLRTNATPRISQAFMNSVNGVWGTSGFSPPTTAEGKKGDAVRTARPGEQADFLRTYLPDSAKPLDGDVVLPNPIGGVGQWDFQRFGSTGVPGSPAASSGYNVQAIQGGSGVLPPPPPPSSPVTRGGSGPTTGFVSGTGATTPGGTTGPLSGGSTPPAYAGLPPGNLPPGASTPPFGIPLASGYQSQNVQEDGSIQNTGLYFVDYIRSLTSDEGEQYLLYNTLTGGGATATNRDTENFFSSTAGEGDAPTTDDLYFFGPREAGVATYITERFLRQARRRRENSAGRRARPGRSYSPRVVNQHQLSGNIVDRALNWRIGF